MTCLLISTKASHNLTCPCLQSLQPLFMPSGHAHYRLRYDLDSSKTRVACDPIVGPYLLAHYKHEDDRDDREVGREDTRAI